MHLSQPRVRGDFLIWCAPSFLRDHLPSSTHLLQCSSWSHWPSRVQCLAPQSILAFSTSDLFLLPCELWSSSGRRQEESSTEKSSQRFWASGVRTRAHGSLHLEHSLPHKTPAGYVISSFSGSPILSRTFIFSGQERWDCRWEVRFPSVCLTPCHPKESK